jgi:hypothetical protein
MRVSDLVVGELYKIRSDRPTTVTITGNGVLDIHLGYGHFSGDSRVRPFDHLVYLGKERRGSRIVMYRGVKRAIFPNAWQHIVPIDDDNS